jgi:hypothetical protein
MGTPKPEQEIPRLEEGVEELEEHIKEAEGAVQRRRDVVGEAGEGDQEKPEEEGGGDAGAPAHWPPTSA